MSRKKVKQNVETKKYRFDACCFACRVTTYSNEDINYCSHCGNKNITVNDHKFLTSVYKGEL